MVFRYTSSNLGLHMDLLYYESPPGVQLLHCISNDAQGGESVYADSFKAAYLLLEREPAHFDILTKFPVTYHYKNDGQHYMQTRPIIDLDPFYRPFSDGRYAQRVKAVNYSPPFQAPYEYHIDSQNRNSWFRRFLTAFKAFEDIVHSTDQQIEDRFDPGTCAVFLNRRILHSRREFTLLQNGSSRSRWLKGTYLDIDSFYSKLRVVCAT